MLCLGIQHNTIPQQQHGQGRASYAALAGLTLPVKERLDISEPPGAYAGSMRGCRSFVPSRLDQTRP